MKTVGELRKRYRYRELLKQYHPDNAGGSIKITQEINAEYDAIFAGLNRVSADERIYSIAENEKFKAVMNEIISLNMTIEVIGSWIWCFDCYPYRSKLKSLGFTWCGKKKAWVWHEEPYSRHQTKESELDDIRAKYGSKNVRGHARRYELGNAGRKQT